MNKKPRPLIALSVIVGNEADVLERFIRSFFPAVDTAVFTFARGNLPRDGGQEVIERVCTELGLPFKILHYTNEVEFDHVDNFGKARQMGWSAAEKTRAKYLMWADCDDILDDGAIEPLRNFATEGKYDIFICPYNVRGGVVVQQQVLRERVVRNNKKSYWRYAIHEQLGFKKQATYTIAKDIVFWHRPLATKGGGRDRNTNILSREVRDASRNYFYLHQEAFEGRQVAKAKTFGHAALNCTDLGVLEQYEILLNLAQCEDGPIAKKYAAEAFAVMPDRREALALLCSYAIVDKNYPKAMQLATVMIGIPKPAQSYWCLNHLWYAWRGTELFAQCLRLTDGEIDVFEKTYFGEGGPTFSIIYASESDYMIGLQAREVWLTNAEYANKVEWIFTLKEDDSRALEMYKGFRHQICQKDSTIAELLVGGAKLARGKIIIPASDNIMPKDLWDTWVHGNVTVPETQDFLPNLLEKDKLSNVYTVIDREANAE
jgi:hypothetical protein